MMALKSGHNVVFPCGLRLHKVQKCTKPQGDTGVLGYVSPAIQKCSCFENVVYDNICTWQLYALFYGGVMAKGRKGFKV